MNGFRKTQRISGAFRCAFMRGRSGANMPEKPAHCASAAFSYRRRISTGLALLSMLLPSTPAFSWAEIAHYYLGEVNQLRAGVGEFCNTPDAFGLTPKNFCWSHDIDTTTRESSLSFGAYGENVLQGIPNAYAMYSLARDKLTSTEWVDLDGRDAASIQDATRYAVGCAFHNLADEPVHYEFFPYPLSALNAGLKHSKKEIASDVILFYEWHISEVAKEYPDLDLDVHVPDVNMRIPFRVFLSSASQEEYYLGRFISPHTSLQECLMDLEEQKSWLEDNHLALPVNHELVYARLLFLSQRMYRKSIAYLEPGTGSWASWYHWESAWTLNEIKLKLDKLYDESKENMAKYSLLQKFCDLW